MDSETREFMEGMITLLKEIKYVDPKDIPNIDLYMDQVTTFLEEQLAGSRQHEKDKLLTKTMINNYAKNDVLPPPEKKKYSKEHILMLVFIYYFKNIMSISDIHTLMSPLMDKYFKNTDGPKIEDIYKEAFSLEYEESQKQLKDLLRKYTRAQETFEDFPEEDRKFLHDFSFICMLSYDVYVKKMIIEHMIDHMETENNR